ncbi:MAG: type II toxin-antitoxin system HicB family antitoxin [Ruminiclostridium sp.]|nr:type II toxin-antitoxin system HicB family antitoxin [Ruminiclostridium sp.]
MKDTYIFPAILDKGEDGISVEFPDLPGCLPCADSIENAVKNAKEAMQLHIYGMESDNEVIPEPTPFERIGIERNQTLMLVEVFMPPFREKMQNKYIKKTVSLPAWLCSQAEHNGINISVFLKEALENELNMNNNIK